MLIYVHLISIKATLTNQYNPMRDFRGMKKQIDLKLKNGNYMKYFLNNESI